MGEGKEKRGGGVRFEVEIVILRQFSVKVRARLRPKELAASVGAGAVGGEVEEALPEEGDERSEEGLQLGWEHQVVDGRNEGPEAPCSADCAVNVGVVVGEGILQRMQCQ